jgi:hypothetical protein
MNVRSALLAGLLFCPPLALAFPRDAKDDLKNAVHKLSQAGSYAWTITSVSSGDTGEKYGFGSGEGKIERGGLTWLKTQESPPVEVAAKGGKMAVRLEDGWALESQLAGGGTARRHPNLSLVRSLKGRPRPAAEAGDLLKRVKELSPGPEGYFTSTLGPEDAMDLLHKVLRTSGRTAEIDAPSGSLAFSVTDGILTKYEIRLRGTVTFSAPAPSTWKADEVITVSISSIGTAKVDLPEEAKKLLE